MKTSYIIILFLLCVFAVPSGSGSQFDSPVYKKITVLQPPQGDRPQRTLEERAKRESEWMKTSLELTESQLLQIDTINLKYAKKQMELRNQMQGQDREAIITKRRELQTQKNEELKIILTEDQMKKYLQELEQRRANRRSGGQPPTP